MRYTIYEVEYSCSPGGIDKWEIATNEGNFVAGNFDTARSAFDYLIDNRPADKLKIKVLSLEWWRNKEKREGNTNE
jgi:hypothetical protein